MGVIINSSLIMLGTVCFICGVSFFIRERMGEFYKFFILLLGIFSSLWCCGYGMMGMAETHNMIIAMRAVGVLGIIGFLETLLIMLLWVVNSPMWITYPLMGIYTVYAVSELIVFSIPDSHEFIRYHGRTTFYVENGFSHNYHTFFIAVSFLAGLIISLIWYFSGKTRQNKSVILTLIVSHIFIVVSGIPDTIMPLLGLPSFPSSCYGVAVAFLVTWYNCVKNNALSITIRNVSNYVYQAVNAHILVFDPEGQLYMANTSSQAFFGIKSASKQKLTSLFELDNQDKLFENVLSGRTDEIKLRARYNGARCSLRFTVARDKKHKPFCVLAFVYDLTKEDSMLEELRKASMAKSEFLSNMSHEIRTPINAIIGMNEMILRESMDEQITEYASSLHNSATALLTIVNDLLDISRIEAGKTELIVSDYQLSSLISDSYGMISERAEQKGLDVTVLCDENLPSVLSGDMVRVRQILTNLLTNAVKYTQKGAIDFNISGEVSGNAVLLKASVKDTGIGITPENLKKLFGKFERFDLQTNRTIEGTGLGLNITKKLTELMGGTITAESEYGKGSVFTVCIPQRIVDSTPVGEISVDAASEPGERYHNSFTAPDAQVLVVDDVEVNLKVFAGLLKQTKIQIDTALNGAESIEKACSKHYDIIFMDHMMPGMDGIETFEKLKQNPKNKNADTPVIMLTANAINGMREMYLKNGFADYISKPIDGAKLEKTVVKYLPAQKVFTVTKGAAERQESSLEESPLTRLSRISGMNLKNALHYCADNEEFCIECLRDYAASGKKEQLEQLFAEQNWERYAIEVHALKSTSRTLGFEELGDVAETLQNAAERREIDVLNENHPKMERLLSSAVSAIKEILG